MRGERRGERDVALGRFTPLQGFYPRGRRPV